MTTATAASLGTNVSVTSWIWVTDWNSEMPRAIPRLVSRMGADTLAVTNIMCRAISITAVSVMDVALRAWVRAAAGCRSGRTTDARTVGGVGAPADTAPARPWMAEWRHSRAAAGCRSGRTTDARTVGGVGAPADTAPARPWMAEWRHSVEARQERLDDE